MSELVDSLRATTGDLNTVAVEQLLRFREHLALVNMGFPAKVPALIVQASEEFQAFMSILREKEDQSRLEILFKVLSPLLE